MAHSIILGITESGKTTLGIMLAKAVKKAGNKVAVLTPLKYEFKRWQFADFITDDPEEFLQYAKKNTNYYLFVDEGATSINKYDEAMNWLTTTARHFGHATTIIAHRYVQLNSTLRSQASKIYLFAVSLDDLKEIGTEWRQTELSHTNFEKGKFVLIRRFGKMEGFTLDFKKAKVYSDELTHNKVDEPLPLAEK